MKANAALKAVGSTKPVSPRPNTEVEKIAGKACLICKVITAGWGNYREGVVCNAAHGEQYEREREERRMTRTS